MPKPNLSVIQGQWQASSKWLDFPADVTARSLFDKNDVCRLRIGREDAIKEARAHKRQSVFNLWSCVLGEPPRVPMVIQRVPRPYDGLTKLENAHACFRGIKRACDGDVNGENFVAYVLKPSHFYVYSPDPVCVAEKSIIPDDLVFVAYAKLDYPCEQQGHALKGVLTHWQFVECDPNNDTLPVDHGSRYVERLW